tara:strand:+ start:573 stop:1373 length:801 start_codon:yes stop_codon:yes gene_type:complete
MKKILLTSGCSMTATQRFYSPTWADHISKSTKMSLLNPSTPGIGNHVIATNCIEGVEKLLQDYHAEDIQVVLQWTGINRYDKIIKKNNNYYTTRPGSFLSDQSDLLVRVLSTWRDNDFWRNHYSNQENEQAFLETLENILMCQFYLKEKNISYKMFCAWDLFTHLDTSSRISLELLNNSNQFTNDNYNNKSFDLIKDRSQITSFFWNLIDWNNFWTFNDEQVKSGGMLQWIKKNVPKQDWFIKPQDYHPSHSAHQQFANFLIEEVL